MLHKNKNPFLLFDEWFDLARQKEINDPNAMNLSSVDNQNKPHSRMVLLKEHSSNGFTFYTNTKSAKGIQIANNNSVALCFHWKSLLRQVRIEGIVNKVKDSVADDYFNSRGYMSRIGAISSKQSSDLMSRSELELKIEKNIEKFPDKNNVPRPDYWTGFLVSANKIEFWQDMPHRIHDRLVFEIQKNGTWNSKKLYP